MNHIFLIALSLLLLTTSAFAEPTEESFTAGNSVVFQGELSDETPPQKNNEQNALDTETISKDAEATLIEDKHAVAYLPSTVQNLSKMYVNKNAAPIDKNLAVDNFLLINECEIYQRFIDDDFEWPRIRDSARKMLLKKKDTFSSQFKITIPIDLGKYDLERKGFPLVNRTAFIDMRRVEIGGNKNNKSICGQNRNIEFYPRNVIMALSKPFNYNFVPVDEHVAQAFVIRQKYEKAKRPKDLQNKRYNRLAFARMRITFKDYQGETKGSNETRLAVMFGRLDGIDIFEDYEETKLLSTVDY